MSFLGSRSTGIPGLYFNNEHLLLRLGLDHDNSESISDRNAFLYTPELLDSRSAVCSDDLKAAEDFAYQDDGLKSHGETHDHIREGTYDDSDDDMPMWDEDYDDD